MNEIYNNKNSPRSRQIREFYEGGKQILKKVNKIVCYQHIIIFLLLLAIIFILMYYFIIYQNEKQFNFYDQDTNITISNVELYKKTLQNLNLNNRTSIIINDSYYRLPDLKMIKSFLEYDDTDKMIYKIDTNDCDNFSFILFGNFLKEQYRIISKLNSSFLFGIAYGINKISKIHHTFNLFLDSHDKFYCIESQQDAIINCFNYKTYEIYRIIF